MNEVKRQLFSVCIILIVTGVCMRILPERSDKRSLKFIVTLILIISVFKIDISSFENLFEISNTAENSECVSAYESKIKQQISDDLIKSMEKAIYEEYKAYDENAKVAVSFNDDKAIATVTSSRGLGEAERSDIKTKIEKSLGLNIELIICKEDKSDR